MAKSETVVRTMLRRDVIRTSRVHFFLFAALAVQIIIYDSWQLITPVTVLQRWIAAALMLVTATAVWYLAHAVKPAGYYRRLVSLLVLADIALASFAIYNQRGMASRAVMLFAVPIIVSAVIRRRSAIFATAIISIAAYITAAVSYFVLNFNEGYRVELYGEVGFYSAIFLVLAGLLAVVTKQTDS